MQSKAATVAEYIATLPKERQAAMTKLRKEIKKNLPKGFREEMNYGMIGYVVPHTLYPEGYHCDPKLPLPFMCIASQKHFVAVYHMGVYAMPELMQWFKAEYAEQAVGKLDMGKSCIRFKKLENIPFGLIGALASKVSVDEWIDVYETTYKRK